MTDSQIRCKHVFNLIGQEICPDCGRYTHEPDTAEEHRQFKEHYDLGKHLDFLCPVEGGTIRGWWSI